MRIFRSSKEAAGQLTGAALAVGNFDGVHLGHQTLFDRAIELATRDGGEPAVLTFDPHPARFFRPELAPPLICNERQKLGLIEAAGVGTVIIEPFDADFAALPPATFAAAILADRLGAAHVVIGEDFVFGQGRRGDLALLRDLGVELGFEAHGVPAVRANAIVVSSTKIREFILMGRVEGAAALLGRPYAIDGLVVQGDGRGRTIGVPTANVDSKSELIPRRGVYAAWAQLPSGEHRQAVVNIGTAPTVRHNNRLTIEAHLIDFKGDLVGRRLGLAYCARLRDEARFGTVDQLVTAIGNDVARAQEILATTALRPPARRARNEQDRG